MTSLRYQLLQKEFYHQPYMTMKEQDLRQEELCQRFDPLGNLERKRQWFVWRTGERNLIPVQFMRESHLYYACQYVMRQLEKYVEQDYDFDCYEFIEKYYALHHFRQEMKRRKLDVPPVSEAITDLAQEIKRRMRSV